MINCCYRFEIARCSKHTTIKLSTQFFLFIRKITTMQNDVFSSQFAHLRWVFKLVFRIRNKFTSGIYRPGSWSETSINVWRSIVCVSQVEINIIFQCYKLENGLKFPVSIRTRLFFFLVVSFSHFSKPKASDWFSANHLSKCQLLKEWIVMHTHKTGYQKQTATRTS